MFIKLFNFYPKRNFGGGILFYFGHLLIFYLLMIAMYAIWSIFFGPSLPPMSAGTGTVEAFTQGQDHGQSFLEANKITIMFIATIYSILISILICIFKSLPFYFYFLAPLTALLAIAFGFIAGMIPSVYLITRQPAERDYSPEHEIYNLDRY